ncbi:MAG: hypothetical protein WBV22_04075 [Anaerolineaceae bacterium]
MGAKLFNNKKVVNTLLFVVIVLLGVNYYSTISYVPFHPDESTYIYMSSDFHQLLNDPSSMIYRPDQQSDLKQHYRLIDPPLTRYLIGAGLSIAGIKSLVADWDWGSTWDKNAELGTLPDKQMLLVSRISVACFFLLALFAIFKTGVQLHNELTGLIAMLLVGSSALILLHTRRAMEESLLLLGISLALWCFTSINKRPWLAGLALVLAVNAKLSAAPLYLMGFAAIFIMDTIQSINWSRRLVNLLIFTLILIIGTFVLNPIAWNQPATVIQAAIQERNALVSEQLASLQNIDPQHALSHPSARIAGLITHLFFSQPSALDIGNYLKDLKPSIDGYLAIPGTSLMRGYLGGTVIFVLTLFGIILMLTKSLFHHNTLNRFWIVFLLGFTFLVVAMTATISLPFQRYVIPLLPFIYLFIAFGISQVLMPNKKAPI